jgi:hypothetical protein
MRAIRSVTNPSSGPGDQEPEADGAQNVFVPWSEARSLDENFSAVSPPPVDTRDDAAVKLPKFEPVAGDLDDLRPVSFHSWTGLPPNRARRGRRWLIALLALAVAMQAVPTFLWLRGRVDPLRFFRTRTEKTLPSAAPAGSDQSVVPPVGTASLPAPGRVPTGTVSVVAPVPMQVFLAGRLLGSTQTGSIAIPVGDHELEFISADTGYRATRRVSVRAGATTRVQLSTPLGLVSINATPWADVFIGDQHIGQTPIGNFKVPIGRRQVTFRHPQLGERRASVFVTLKRPARLAVDMERR